MKIGKKTLEVLKNFAGINPSILIKPGNKVTTMAVTKKIVAEATVEETFDSQLCLYELQKFLGVVSMLRDPEIELGEKSAKISSEGRVVEYFYTAPSTIVTPPEKGIVMPTPELTIDLPAEKLSEIVKSAGVLGVPDVVLVVKDGKALLRATDLKNSTSHSYDVELGETDTGDMSVPFKVAALKMVPASYKLEAWSRGIGRFSNPDITYYGVAEVTR